MRSTDYPLRAIAFGNESARISGEVVVNPDGSKVFRKIEIKPLDTNFDFEHNTKNPLIEGSRAVGRQILDPGDYGSKYEIQYRGYGRPGEPDPDCGIGRIYHPFTDAQLSAARRKEFAYPGSAPSGLLPSFTAAPPPAIKEHLQYLDQANAGQAQATGASAAMPPFRQSCQHKLVAKPCSCFGRHPGTATVVAALGLLWFALGALAFAASAVFRDLSKCEAHGCVRQRRS